MRNTTTNETAVSPIVGVMLMLVVTIIIAAVVSAFAGGLSGSQAKAPSIAMDVDIGNTGSDHSYFDVHVNSVSDTINTKDLKLVTSWSTTMKDNTSAELTTTLANTPNGTVFSGGNTTLPNVTNTRYHSCRSSGTCSLVTRIMPYGYGPGVASWGAFGSQAITSDMQFGNYSLMSGTTLHVYPVAGFSATGSGVSTSSGYGAVTSYHYTVVTSGSSFQSGDYDGMMAVLGTGWENLRAGDRVNVQLIHIPSGKVIYNTDISVKGA
jgi:archaeal type IV pilus assembly protein PilA